MRVVLLCAGLLGCVASEEEDEVKGPDVSALPPGTGWGCWYDKIANESSCTRPAACEPTRQAVAEEFNRTGINYSFSPCVPRERVACFTTRLATSTLPHAWCVEYTTECEAIRKRVASNPEFKDTSGRCGVYP